MGMAGAGVPFRELGLVMLVAIATTYLTAGLIRYIMMRYGKMAEIRERDVHSVPKPRLGGLAMWTGFLAGIVTAAQLPALTRGFLPVTPEMTAVLAASVVIVGVGIIDDLFDLDPVTKLLGQTFGALLMSLLGLSWTFLFNPFDGRTETLDQFFSCLVTVLVTVTLINAINFVDGLDGLAAGLGMLAGLAILGFALTVLHDQGGTVSAYPPAIIAAGLVGICAGFLPHNFAPSRIFMGDSGSMLIGLLLAAASTSASGKLNMSLYGPVDMIGVLSPFIVVAAATAIPMLDLVLAVIRRTAKGTSPFKADKMHLHHRLLELGHSHRRVVLILYSWTSVVAFGAVAFTAMPPAPALVITALGLVGAFLFTIRPERIRGVVGGEQNMTKLDTRVKEL